MRPVYFIIFIFVTIIGLSLVQITTSNQISTAGSQLAVLQNKIDDYKRENAILQEQVLEASSLTNISAEAEKSGFVQSPKQISLVGSPPLAL